MSKTKLTLEQLKAKLIVTKDGKVFRIYDNYEYAQSNNGCGYLYSASEYVHRLVARFYIPNPNDLPCVNHIDGNKQNNNVDNLEWCTYSDNGKHAVKTGLQPVNKGCAHYSTDLTITQLQEIIDLFINGTSRHAIAVRFGISIQAIGRIINGTRYKDEKLDRSKVKLKPREVLNNLTEKDIKILLITHNNNFSHIAAELSLERKTVSNYFNSLGYTGTSGAPKQY